MDTIVTKQLLFEHFAGRLTALQRGRVEEWLQLAASQELYFEWLEEWEQANPQYITNSEAALQRSLVEIDRWEAHGNAVTTGLRIQRHYLFSRRWLSVAASVLLCLGAGLYFTQSYWRFQTIQTAYGEVRALTLPDGSAVTLNANSTLTLPRFGFGKRSREVQLVGEAAFLVRHTPTHQRFIVHTAKGIDVVVLGTEFNVYARPRGTRIALTQGKIQLTYQVPNKNVQTLLMRPGELVRVDTTGELAIEQNRRPDTVTAWQEHRFVFAGTSMTEIAALVKENYNLTVKLKNEQLAKRTVSGAFQAKDADEFIQVIAELLEINYNRQDTIVTFFE